MEDVKIKTRQDAVDKFLINKITHQLSGTCVPMGKAENVSCQVEVETGANYEIVATNLRFKT